MTCRVPQSERYRFAIDEDLTNQARKIAIRKTNQRKKETRHVVSSVHSRLGWPDLEQSRGTHIRTVIIKHGRNILSRKGVGRVRNQQACLSDGTVTDHDTCLTMIETIGETEGADTRGRMMRRRRSCKGSISSLMAREGLAGGHPENSQGRVRTPILTFYALHRHCIFTPRDFPSLFTIARGSKIKNERERCVEREDGARNRSLSRCAFFLENRAVATGQQARIYGMKRLYASRKAFGQCVTNIDRPEKEDNIPFCSVC